MKSLRDENKSEKILAVFCFPRPHNFILWAPAGGNDSGATKTVNYIFLGV
jgi:hypothetical protein